MDVRHRRAGLAVAALATVIAVAWTAAQDDATGSYAAPASAPAAETERSVPPVAKPGFPDIGEAQARRARFADPVADPFAAKTWNPRVDEKPAAPVAPPMPYTYFGRMSEDGKLYVFLQRGERTYMVTDGDVVDQEYRVEEIAPNAVVMTYLPLKQRQVLHTGS